jgi:hypothetical protein
MSLMDEDRLREEVREWIRIAAHYEARLTAALAECARLKASAQEWRIQVAHWEALAAPRLTWDSLLTECRDELDRLFFNQAGKGTADLIERLNAAIAIPAPPAPATATADGDR